MPVLAQFWGSGDFFDGPFEVFNEPYPQGGWAWVSHTGTSSWTLSWNRPDGETVIDLAQVLSKPAVTGAIDGFLTGDISRTSPLYAEGQFWNEVPYRNQDPGRHQDLEMLVRIYFDMHIHTPWYCSDADGNISFYLFFYLDDSGALHGYVDGWSYDYNGGGPFCTGGIDDALNQAIPAAIPTMQNLIDEAIALLGPGTYTTLYYLPGSGRSDGGDFTEDADTNVALVLLPAGGN